MPVFLMKLGSDWSNWNCSTRPVFRLHKSQPAAVAQRIVDTLEHLLNWSGSIWMIEDQRMLLMAASPMGLTDVPIKKCLTGWPINNSSNDGIIGWVSKNGRQSEPGV